MYHRQRVGYYSPKFQARLFDWLRSFWPACVAFALVGVLSFLTNCGGNGAESRSFVADERQTVIDSYEDHNQKVCFILTEEICQSPDSAVFFHLPRELHLITEDRQVADEMRISNRGIEPVVFAEYKISLMDDHNVVYQPEFIGPGNYSNTKSFEPALVLEPGEEVSVFFATRLRPESEGIQGIWIQYRLIGEDESSRVVVSYRPRNIQSIMAK